MIGNKKLHIRLGIGIILLLTAFFTRKWWMPISASIKITNVDWDKKIVTYDIYIQGEKINTQPINRQDGKDFVENWTMYGHKFQETGGTLGGLLWITIYKGHLDGVPISEYLSGVAISKYGKLTLSCTTIDFSTKTITDCKG